MKRRPFAALLFSVSFVLIAGASAPAAEPVRYLRFQKGRQTAYGLLEGDRVRQLSGDLFGDWKKTETT